MKIYTIEEDKYSELEGYIEKIVNCGKKILTKMQDEEFCSRMEMRRHDEFEDDDYDWKIKKGRYRY